MLIVDETGFVKKGPSTAVVARVARATICADGREERTTVVEGSYLYACGQDRASAASTGAATPLACVGVKGERLYEWALTPLWCLQIAAEERRFGHYLLVRRSLDEKRERAYYIVYAPRSKATRQTLVNVAGRQVGLAAADGECGLDQYEVRRRQSWYRHITLPLLAHAARVTLRVQGKKHLTVRCR